MLEDVNWRGGDGWLLLCAPQMRPNLFNKPILPLWFERKILFEHYLQQKMELKKSIIGMTEKNSYLKLIKNWYIKDSQMKHSRGQETKINSECFWGGFVKQLMNSGFISISKRKIREIFYSRPLCFSIFACLECFF